MCIERERESGDRVGQGLLASQLRKKKFAQELYENAVVSDHKYITDWISLLSGHSNLMSTTFYLHSRITLAA